MLVTLNFHPAFQEMTGVKSHQVDVNSISDIRHALVALFPKMRRYIKTISTGCLKENISLITPEGELLKKKDYEFNRLKHEELTLVPILEGSGGKSGLLMVLLGVVLIGLALFTGGAFAAGGLAAFDASAKVGIAGLTAGGLLKMGIGLVLAGLMQMMMKPPEPVNNSNNNQQRRNNDMFDALENTTDTNANVPLIYGAPRVAGQMLSGHVETIKHGENDTIAVSDIFYTRSDEITRTN